MGRHTVLTEDQILYIRANTHRLGLWVISQKLGLHYGIVKAYCERENLEHRIISRKTILTKEQKELILYLFYKTHDNDTQTIADELEMGYSLVSEFLSRYLRRKEERLAKRKYEDIDWGELSN